MAHPAGSSWKDGEVARKFLNWLDLAVFGGVRPGGGLKVYEKVSSVWRS